MYRALPHILAAVFGPPLLIAPAKLDAMLLGLHAALRHRGSLMLPDLDGRVTPEAAFDKDGPSTSPPADERPRGYTIRRGVATVPVHGVLVRRAGQMTPDSTPLMSYEVLSRILARTQSDQRVRGILLDIDSPGGEAGGVFDAATELRRIARAGKPIWAIANDDALSAAYVLASAADRVWATQTAALGSLGVVALHADQSAFDAEEGIKYTYLYRGARKIDAHPHGPLGREASVTIQGEVDRLYDTLVAVVGAHRSIDPARIRNTEAAVYFGDRAKEPGLVDSIGTLDEAHAALAQHVQPRGVTIMETTQAPPATTTETPPTPPPADNVIQLRVTEAVAAANAQSVEIAQLCALARYPELAAGFMAEGVAVAIVIQRLQERQAADSAKRSIVALDPNGVTPRGGSLPTAAELEAAAKARFKIQNARSW